MTTLVAAVALGLAGSLHCVAMCGPLVALAGRSPRRMLQYHAGRLTAYAAIGLLAGLVGAGVAHAGFGRGLSIAAGAGLLLQALSASAWVSGGVVGRRVAQAASHVVGTAGAWLRRHGVQGPFTVGALSGLLPCGLLYAAITAAVGLGSAALAVGFMLAFGLGTLPLLALVGIAAERFAAHTPVRLRRAGPLMLAALGLLLVVRGLAMPHAVH